MALLLDTHTLLWWATDDTHLSDPVRDLIQNEDNRILVSAASAWEITTKVRLGKLPQADVLINNLADYLYQQNFESLSITVHHARAAGRLPGPHRDPFDRMLIAQAICEDLAILGLDTAFDDYPVTRIW